ncbi:HtaA domain-containing protein [Streptomyces sp. NPDC050738]|uniref:HtaA domain-containing protein n=1 Tax=Streptomyces sp. NPDC050738 TaxID=3154744 RepID=UPI003443776C
MVLSIRAARVSAVAVLAALFAALLPAVAAHASSRTVQGGRLDWGIKSSFQSYVTGPVAKGSYSLTGGAATVGSSQFRFASARGTYDGDTGAFRAGFSGGVHFVGHKKSNGSYELDMTISNPTVSLSGGGGTLYADITSKAKGSGAVTSQRQVAFATLSTGSVDMKGGGNSVRLGGLPATLTAAGARSFAGYYAAGTALDPVSLSADVRAAATKKPSPTASASKSADAGKKTTTPGKIDDGAVDWGVRRTFREYVTGDIAKGKWALADGAKDGGALFRFGEGSGAFDAEKQTLTAAFKGSVRFTGAHGLDLSFSDLHVTVKDGAGTLRATTAGAAAKSDVPLVTFAAKNLKATGGLVALTEVPTTLTAEGAKAFNSMYPKGTSMDPLTLSIALTDSAKLPALPDLGSAPTATAPPSAKASPVKAEATAASSDSSAALPAGIAAASVLLLAATAFTVVRRRRATAAASDDTPAL